MNRVPQRIQISCAKCEAGIAQQVNAWSQIGKNYLTPILPALEGENVHITISKSIFPGLKGTLVAGW